MPELPEVETTRRGIEPHVAGRTLTAVTVREPRLRWPVDARVAELRDKRIVGLRRRAKRVVPAETPLRKHDHIDLHLDSGRLLRFNDPRRFGALLYLTDALTHPLLANLGPEPLDQDFSGGWLYRRSRGRRVSVKSFIMDNATVVGVGNIYAQESLFLAGIHPSRPAGRISEARYQRLALAIRSVLAKAIEAGGTTLRDFTSADGQPGYFAQQLLVYGRADEPCPQCAEPLRGGRHGQRSTVYCPRCQR